MKIPQPVFPKLPVGVRSCDDADMCHMLPMTITCQHCRFTSFRKKDQKAFLNLSFCDIPKGCRNQVSYCFFSVNLGLDFGFTMDPPIPKTGNISALFQPLPEDLHLDLVGHMTAHTRGGRAFCHPKFFRTK